jgi:hypothetical protein
MPEMNYIWEQLEAVPYRRENFDLILSHKASLSVFQEQRNLLGSDINIEYNYKDMQGKRYMLHPIICEYAVNWVLDLRGINSIPKQVLPIDLGVEFDNGDIEPTTLKVITDTDVDFISVWSGLNLTVEPHGNRAFRKAFAVGSIYATKYLGKLVIDLYKDDFWRILTNTVQFNKIMKAYTTGATLRLYSDNSEDAQFAVAHAAGNNVDRDEGITIKTCTSAGTFETKAIIRDSGRNTYRGNITEEFSDLAHQTYKELQFGVLSSVDKKKYNEFIWYLCFGMPMI